MPEKNEKPTPTSDNVEQSITSKTSSKTTKNSQFIDFLTYYDNLCNFKTNLRLYVNNVAKCMLNGMSQIDDLPEIQAELVYKTFKLDPKDFKTALTVSAYLPMLFPEGVTAKIAYKLYGKEIPEHYEMRLKLVVLLKEYMTNLKVKYGVVIGEDRYTEFQANKESFMFFKDTQAQNRIINGLLTQKLSRKLIYTEQPIEELFEKTCIDEERDTLCQMFKMKSIGIYSNDLNDIIAAAQEFSSLHTTGPIL